MQPLMTHFRLEIADSKCSIIILSSHGDRPNLAIENVVLGIFSLLVCHE